MKGETAGRILARAALTAFVGCARPANDPSARRPVEEDRAISVIGQAYRRAGQTVESGRDLQLPSGRRLRVDVGTAGRKYGIAFLTSADLAQLDAGRDLPPPMPADDLPVVQGAGPDADAVVLVLLATHYVEMAGAPAAEEKIARDVRDFLAQARARHLP